MFKKLQHANIAVFSGSWLPFLTTDPWIGAFQIGSLPFQLTDASGLDYTNWAVGQPTNPCAQVCHSSATNAGVQCQQGKWRTSDCETTVSQIICKRFIGLPKLTFQVETISRYSFWTFCFSFSETEIPVCLLTVKKNKCNIGGRTVLLFFFLSGEYGNLSSGTTSQASSIPTTTAPPTGLNMFQTITWSYQSFVRKFWLFRKFRNCDHLPDDIYYLNSHCIRLWL